MTEFSRLNAVFADDLHLQREQVARRALRTGRPVRRTTRRSLASGLHRLADRLDGR